MCGASAAGGKEKGVNALAATRASDCARPAPDGRSFDHDLRPHLGAGARAGAINLGQGFPDLPEPAELLEAARRALVEHSNQYPPMRGLAELRRAVCEYYRQEQGLERARGGGDRHLGRDRGARRRDPRLRRPGRRGDPVPAVLRRLPAAGRARRRHGAHGQPGAAALDPAARRSSRRRSGRRRGW